jgi:glycosyltransferase involved in cell wall biosynthesis
MTKKKILFVSNQASLTGAPIFLLNLVKHLNESKPDYDTTIFFSSRGELTSLASTQGIPQFVSTKRANSKGKFIAVLARTLHYLYFFKVLVTVRPHLVYSNTCTNFGEVVIAGLCRIPIIMHMHEGQQFANAFASRLKASCYFVKQVIAGSVYTQNVFSAITKKSSVVIYNGIQANAKNAKPIKQTKSPLTVGILGTIDSNKGQHIAINAVELLARKGHRVLLQIAGKVSERKYFNSLETMLKNSDCEKQVRFLGVVENAATFIQSLDILLVPSFDEAFPTVILEAFSQNTLVIASKVGGIPEMILDHSNGLLVEPGKPEVLATAIEDVLCNLDLLITLPAAALRTLQLQFDVTESYHSITAIIDKHL